MFFLHLRLGILPTQHVNMQEQCSLTSRVLSDLSHPKRFRSEESLSLALLGFSFVLGTILASISCEVLLANWACKHS